MTNVQITEKQENETTTAFIAPHNPRVSLVLIGAVIGGVVGSLLVLALLFLLLAPFWMTKKCRRAVDPLHQQEQPEKSDQREAIQQIQHQEVGDEAMEMKSNDAYISTTRHNIPTEENVAYGLQVENDYNLISDQLEYDYI